MNKVPENERRDDRVNVAVTKQEKKTWLQYAKWDGRKLADWVRVVVNQKIEEGK